MNGKINTGLISVLVILVGVFSIIYLNSLIGDLNKSEIILAESDSQSPDPTIKVDPTPNLAAKVDPTPTPKPTVKADPTSVPKHTKKPHPTSRPNNPIIMSNKTTSPNVSPTPTPKPANLAEIQGIKLEVKKLKEQLGDQDDIKNSIEDLRSFNTKIVIAIAVIVIMLLYLLFYLSFSSLPNLKEMKRQNLDQFRELTLRVERMERESKRAIGQTGDQFNQRIVNPEVERANRYTSLKSDTPVSPSPTLNKPYQPGPYQSGMGERIPESQQRLSEEEYIQQLVRLYNLAANNEQQAERSFFETYKPIRLGVANVMEKAKDVGQIYQFEPLNDGDYLAIDYSKYQPGMYLVVPRFKLNYQDNLHGPGGMGYVFQSDNYDARMRYYLINLIRPSIFQGGSSWFCAKKGRLRLEQGEPIS